jgi:hypothetical protein
MYYFGKFSHKCVNTSFKSFSTDWTVYRELTAGRTALIQRSSMLYYTLINKYNVQPTMYVEISFDLPAFK